MEHHRIDIVVIVNGQPALVSANPEADLSTVIPKALEETGNTGQPPENWELRDAHGTLLDVHKRIDTFRFPPDVRLFLNLKAGVGGS